MQVWCDWQLTLCDPHLSALEVRFHDDALYKSMFTFTFTLYIQLRTENVHLCPGASALYKTFEQMFQNRSRRSWSKRQGE